MSIPFEINEKCLENFVRKLKITFTTSIKN